MFLAGFHATCRHGPNVRSEIDLIPAHTSHFSRTRGREDDKLKSACRYAVSLTQIGHERWHIAPIKSGMMLHAPHGGRSG